MLGRGWSEHCLGVIGESSLALHRETLCLVKDIRGGTVSQGRKFILKRVWCWPEEVERTVPKAQKLRDLGGCWGESEGQGLQLCDYLLRKCAKTASGLP